jgi:hypothetical protein
MIQNTDSKLQKAQSSLFSFLISYSGACIVLVLGALSFFADGPAPGSNKSLAGVSSSSLKPCVLDAPGYIRGKLFGAIQLTMDVEGSSLRCDGTIKPNEQGMRLVFAYGDENSAQNLTLIIGLGARKNPETELEFPTNLTIIDNNDGRFFSTQGEGRCWTTINQQAHLATTSQEIYRIDGTVYCVSPLPELNGNNSITPGEISFSGRLRAGIP